jgi:conjugal transfer ATP-binding protein TraC
MAANPQKKPLPKQQPLNELMPYWELHDGVMFLADGRMEIGIEVKFPPAMFLTDGGLEFVIRQLKNVLRNGVPQGQRLRMVLEVGPAGRKVVEGYKNETTSASRAGALFGQKRAEYYENLAALPSEVLNWRAFFTVTLGEKRLGSSPGLLSYALSRIIPSMQTQTHMAYTPEEFKERIQIAQDARTRLVSFLAMAGFSPKPMDSSEVFGMCFRFFNPGLKQSPIPPYRPTWQYAPEDAVKSLQGLAPPTLRSQVAKSEVDNTKLHELGLGWRRARMLSMVQSPDETNAGMLNAMLDTSGDLYLIIDLVHEPHDQAIGKLKLAGRRYYSAANSDMYVDPNVRAGLSETEAAIEHIALSGDHIYQVGATLILLGSQTKELEERVSTAFSRAAMVPGSPFVVMQNGLLEPFMQCAPMSGNMIDFRVSLLETNASHFFPVGSPWAGSKRPTAMFHNRWKSLTFVDPFDPQMTNWNALIVGGSGQGKTFLSQYLITELLRQDDVDVIVVDRGRGYEKTVELFEGAMIDIEPGGDLSINPFDLEPGETEPDEEKVAFLASLIRTMVGNVDARLEAEEDAIIATAIRTTYTRKTDEVLVGGEYKKVLETVLLRDFVKTLSNLERIGEKTVTPEDKKIADTLARTLQNWTGKTPYGSFIDRPTNIPHGDSRVVCYDTSKFQTNSPLATVGILMIADMVWRRVKRDPTRRKIVIFDECWALLQIPAAAQFMVELYRRFRRYGAAAWSISQSLQDFMTEESRGLLQNTTYYYLLRVPGEDDIVGDLLHLPPSATNAFRNLRRVNGLYSEVLVWMRKEAGIEGDVLWIRPSSFDYWAFTTSAVDMVKRDNVLKQTGGDLLRALEILSGGNQ